MTKPETVKKLEERYHCHITKETRYRPYPWSGEYELFCIYSMDNCHWETVIGYHTLVKELADSKDALRRLANLEMLIAEGN